MIFSKSAYIAQLGMDLFLFRTRHDTLTHTLMGVMQGG
jgi:hypothetical protein